MIVYGPWGYPQKYKWLKFSTLAASYFLYFTKPYKILHTQRTIRPLCRRQDNIPGHEIAIDTPSHYIRRNLHAEVSQAMPYVGLRSAPLLPSSSNVLGVPAQNNCVMSNLNEAREF
jgi:hypothetical protein